MEESGQVVAESHSIARSISVREFGQAISKKPIQYPKPLCSIPVSRYRYIELSFPMHFWAEHPDNFEELSQPIAPLLDDLDFKSSDIDSFISR